MRIKKKRLNKCKNCGKTEDEVDLDVMPCCGELICWDFCLYEEPEICPYCGALIRVVSKDEITKESYIEVIFNKIDNETRDEVKSLLAKALTNLEWKEDKIAYEHIKNAYNKMVEG